METPQTLSSSAELRVARRVTWVGFFVNAVLGVLKILAGIFGRSSAMVADGVHSFTDFFSDIIVLIFIGVSRREANGEYPYGHGKFETFATMLLAMSLIIVGVWFFVDGLGTVIKAIHGEPLPAPTWLALSMALVSIAAKEILFHYTRIAGRRINSPAIIANAWHHRSDALSSVATLVGIVGAMFLGTQWRILDPLAAILVSVFIIIVSFKIGMPAVKELLEVSLPGEITGEMYKIIGATPGVKAFHHFASRRNGNRFIADFHIKVDHEISVREAHAIASDVENRLKTRFGASLLATIHIEPYRGEKTDPNKMTL